MSEKIPRGVDKRTKGRDLRSRERRQPKVTTFPDSEQPLADPSARPDLAPIVAELQTEGPSLRQIADRLNAEGHTTRRGKPWNQVQVKRVLERAGS